MIPTKESIEIGSRIAVFLDSKYGTRREAAAAMDMEETHLSQLCAGKLPFGPKMKRRFEAVGGNVTHALTGIYPNAELQKKSAELEIEERNILKYLRSQGIDTLEKVQTVYKSYSPVLRVAEKMAEYKKKKS